MTFDQILLIGIIIITTTLLITRWTPIEVTALLAIAGLALAGLLPAKDALSGFSNTATLTVGAMFVLSGGLMRTGALEAVTVFLARYSRGNVRRLLLYLGGIVAVGSAFVNNTPVVVMMVPVLLSLGEQLRIRPSKLLIPLSYFSIIGGTMTLLGTSTNILIDGLYRSAGGPGFGIFDFMPLGIVFTGVGIIYLVLISQRLLPDHAPLTNLLGVGNQNAYISEFVVTPESPVVGKPASQVFDRIATLGRSVPTQTGRQHRRIANPQRQHTAPGGEKDAIELLQVIRMPKAYYAEEAQKLTLQVGDVLTVAGTPKQITLFAENNGLELMSVLEDGERKPMGDVEHKVVEAVVLPSSTYRHRLIGDLDLNSLYGVKIMGLQHRGRQMVSGLRETRLAAGDVLLLQGRPEDLRIASERSGFMLVEGADAAILRTTKNRVALVIMLGVVLLAALTDIPIVILALAGAALMILTKCLRTDEALRAVDASTIFLLAGTIPLGLAMETTGLAQLMVDGLIAALGHAPPVIFLSVFYLLTNLLTQILSNNAVAVLLVPIALNLSVTLGVDPKPLLMAVAFAASASFMTPMGYQTNAIVMGPGGYTVRDYLRVGVPLSLIMWLLASLLIPVFWPL